MAVRVGGFKAESLGFHRHRQSLQPGADFIGAQLRDGGIAEFQDSIELGLGKGLVSDRCDDIVITGVATSGGDE